MSNWFIILFVIFILFVISILIYFRKKKRNNKTGMDGTNRPPEDIYPLY